MRIRTCLLYVMLFTILCTTITAYAEHVNTDVNGDGEVNILDLVRVASVFGQLVSAENAVADVNGDNEINILDLVRVAGDFGKEIVTHDTEPEATDTEPEATDTEPEAADTEPSVPTQEPGGITISEIMYSADRSSSPPQWIELYNAGTDRISLRGWQLVIENKNTPDLSSFRYVNLTITIEDKYEDVPSLFPQETALIVTSDSRLSDDMHTTGLSETQIYEVDRESDVFGFDGSDTMLSVEAFRIKLVDPDGNVVDTVGNFDGTTQLWWFNLGHRGKTREGYRSSVMRRYEKGVALDGTKKESWIPAVDANLTESQRTHYGVDTDIGSPGIPPETEQ